MNLKEDKKLIIMVEDNTIFAETVKNGLENELGFTVKHFTTGEEMLVYLTNNPSVLPEIFIQDYYLDSIVATAKNGGEILQELVQRYKQKKMIEDLRVIMLTSSDEIRRAIELLKKGATDYILKDEVFFDNLKKTILNVLKIKELKAERKQFKEQAEKYKKRLIVVSIALTLVIVTLSIIYVLSKS
jgi:DNA-binding NtrC family response regulator